MKQWKKDNVARIHAMVNCERRKEIYILVKTESAGRNPNFGHTAAVKLQMDFLTKAIGKGHNISLIFYWVRKS